MMRRRTAMWRDWIRRGWPLLLILLLLGGYWLLPIAGQVVIAPAELLTNSLWPQMRMTPADPQPGETVTVSVTDRAPWSHVLLTVNGAPAIQNGWQEQHALGVWTWFWSFPMPDVADAGDAEASFYTDCHTGCRQRGQLSLTASAGLLAQQPPATQPTKLCTVFPDPARDWHGRSGWVVHIAYMKLADDLQDTYWSVDSLAARVYAAKQQGLRVLVRIEFARGQTLPPDGDYIALSDYLAYVQRLTRDERLRAVDAFIIGSGPNAADANSLAPDRPVTPEWYGRVFNGYGEPVDHTDNVVQTMRAVNPAVRILAGPVRPWVTDQDGSRTAAMDVPWLNYMNTLVWAIDQSAAAKSAAGFVNAGADGFAVHAPGNPDAAEVSPAPAASEPLRDLPRAAWNGAQAGFRIYADWLNVINAYPSTRGLPVYITATNTFAAGAEQPPAQNYPPGWLTNALSVVNREPQVQALCWFLDLVPGDDQWDGFSLSRHPGQLLYANQEFDALLRQEPEQP